MIRLLLVDDQLIIRQGLKSLLDAKPDLQVVGEAENGAIALQQVALLQPDVVLMDVRMPIMDGVTATRLLCQQFPDTKVIVLTTFDDHDYVAQAMQFGARGYLLKDTHSDELAQAIRSIHQGYTQLGPGLFEKAMMPAAPPLPPELAQLTLREREVLRLILLCAL
jgi:DNA-binding NarL/FixJ family response regulator